MGMIFILLLFISAFCGCPNMCNSHGTCESDGTCTCITNTGVGVNQRRFSSQAYTGPDCSLRTCPVGLSFSISAVEGIIPDKVNNDLLYINQRLLQEGLPSYLETENLILVEINNTLLFGKYGGSMTCERINITNSEDSSNFRFLFETEEDATSNEGDKTEEEPTTKPAYNTRNTTTIANINVLAQSGKYLLILWDEEMKKLYGEELIPEDNNSNNDNNNDNSDSTTQADSQTSDDSSSSSSTVATTTSTTASTTGSISLSSIILQCKVLSKRTDLSLTIITTFEDDIYNNNNNNENNNNENSGTNNNNNNNNGLNEVDEEDLSTLYSTTFYNSTIPYYNRLLSYNNFSNDIIYNFACISNLETNKVLVYDAIISTKLYNNSNNNNNSYNNSESINDEIMFLLNTTNVPEGPCYFLGDGKNNIQIEKSEVYKKYMKTIGNEIFFKSNQLINSVNGYKEGVNVKKGKNGLELVLSELRSDNKTVGSFTIDNINYGKNGDDDDDKIDNDDDDEKDNFLLEASYIDIDSFFGNNKNEVIVHLKVGSILQFIVTQNRVTYIKVYVITKIIFINYYGDICDSSGKIIKPHIETNKKRILQSQSTTTTTTTTNSNSNNNNNNNLIMVFTTEPPFNDLNDATVIYTIKSQENSHKYIECSGSGLCNRNTGKCECFVGFEGDACQRISCPFNCNNHGRCVSISEAINGVNKDRKISTKFGYNGGDNESEKKFFGCLCDSGYRGPDCSLRECPSFVDPERATNQRDYKDGISPLVGAEHRDCSGRGICDYSTGNCKCFDGFVGTGCESIASVK